VTKGSDFRCVQDQEELRGILEATQGAPQAGRPQSRRKLEFVTAAGLSLLIIGGTVVQLHPRGRTP